MSSKVNVEAASSDNVGRSSSDAAPSEPSSQSVVDPQKRSQKQNRKSRKKNGADNGPQSQPVYYRSPNLCCCDLQSGLICMAIIDIIVAFIALVIFLAAWAGPTKTRSTTVEEEPVYHHRRHYYIYHRPRYYHYTYWKRAIADALSNSTTLKPLTTTAEAEKPDNTFFIIGVVVSILMMAACIGLLIGAIIRSRGATWGSLGVGWLIFIGAGAVYLINVIGTDDVKDSAGSIILLVLAVIYRVYETFVVYYFVKEPPPPEVRYVAAPGETVYATSPVVYQPAYAPGYYPYYGPGYGYPYGYGVAAGVGLGLAMDPYYHGGFYDDYYY